jgi:N-hydroxyarylamine O-acetyltransferase
MSEAKARALDEWTSGLLDLPAYLRRIGYAGELAATSRTLARLHRAHVTAIPFENADIMLGRSVAVDLPGIQDKLVRRGRGGYCFEHDARTHLVLRVHAGQDCWLADTGFGTGLIEPLQFDGGTPACQYGWTYRLHVVSEHRWQLQELRNGEWATLYRFDDQPQYAADILVANHFTSTYPDSHFVRQLVLIRKDSTGLRRLTGRRLSVARPGHPGEEHQLSDGEFAVALTEMFGLHLSAAEAARLTAITADREGDGMPGSST